MIFNFLPVVIFSLIAQIVLFNMRHSCMKDLVFLLFSVLDNILSL